MVIEYLKGQAESPVKVFWFSIGGMPQQETSRIVSGSSAPGNLCLKVSTTIFPSFIDSILSTGVIAK